MAIMRDFSKSSFNQFQITNQLVSNHVQICEGVAPLGQTTTFCMCGQEKVDGFRKILILMSLKKQVEPCVTITTVMHLLEYFTEFVVIKVIN